MKTCFADRAFQLWEYKVSHGSLLIRSPKGPGIHLNIDLICVGVEYLAAPRHMRGLDLQEPTAEEIEDLSRLLHREVQLSSIRVIVSEHRRFPVVAASFRISENDGDIFDSPFV